VSSTRDRILAAARELIQRDNAGAPNMSAIAREAGISRQALYLHFRDRASLLVALVAEVDERTDLRSELEAVNAAADAEAQIQAWAAMQTRRNPRIAPLARALDIARHADRPASAAWRDRTDNRMRGAVAIVDRLRAEGRLDLSWAPDEAAKLIWELTSFRVWDDLVTEAGLAPERYVEIVTTAALAALASPVISRPGRARP
jgi:AcrR family transcriptional regulator